MRDLIMMLIALAGVVGAISCLHDRQAAVVIVLFAIVLEVIVGTLSTIG